MIADDSLYSIAFHEPSHAYDTARRYRSEKRSGQILITAFY
jgi:hypothetical protein